jgi:glycosyltransferase involved in cell wall biosynthesis
VRIAIIAPLVTAIREPQGGGSQAFLADLARGLAGRGHQVDVYAATGSAIPDVTVIDTGIDPETLSATLYRAAAGTQPAPAPGSSGGDINGSDHPVVEGGNPATAARADPATAAFAHVYDLVRRTSRAPRAPRAAYDVIHNHAFDAPAVRLAANLPAPVVHTLHLPPDRPVAAALRQVLSGEPHAPASRPPAIVVVSQSQAAAWRPVVPVDAVIPSLVPTCRIAWSAAPGNGAMFAGRLSAEKGTAEAIDIAARAGVAIEVYGDPYDERYAREQIDPRRGSPGVTIHPGVPRADVWAAMARAAVVICPVLWDEPFGMVAAEAQACGTPVVAFRRGGLAETITDGVTGFLVAPGDIQAAADRVREAAGLSRPACRDHAEQHLDLERSLDGYEQLYRRVSSSGVRAAPGG